MAAKGLNRGLFITFEGSEGGGKSTQSKMLLGFLRRRGLDVLYIRDPGTTALGEAVRKILLRSKRSITPNSEMLLYMAARAQLAEEKIMPALSQKKIVICDRYADATVSYQGYGLGLSIDMINRLNRFVTRSLMPDITFLLDSDIQNGLRRSRGVKGFSDRIESRSYNFHRKVRNGYLALAKQHPRRIKRLPIEKSTKEETQIKIRDMVLSAIARRRLARNKIRTEG